MGIEIERRAQNQVTFRRANDDIAQARERLAIDGATPYVCECGDAECRELVRLSTEEYEGVRAHPARFFILPGHAAVSAEVVSRRDGYVVVEKKGLSRTIAYETNLRTEA